MATNAETNEEQGLQQFHIRQRRALNNGLAALLGSQANQVFSAFTFEDAVDLQIERIEGAGTQLRPNRLDRVDRIENELIKAVIELKEVPPENFLEADPDNDVNTEA
jgi:hypothetical protein